MKIKRLTSNAKLPVPARATAGAAGYDLMSASLGSLTIYPGEYKVIPCGFAFAIPDGWVGLIRPRSGLAVKHGVSVMAGVIDSDFRGEVGVVLRNDGSRPWLIKEGYRIAQLVVVPYYSDEVEEVDDIGRTHRGGDGFGSTGQ